MLDFDYYCDEFGGCEIDNPEEFDRAAELAEQFLRNVIYGEPDFEDDDVRYCLCAVAELYARDADEQEMYHTAESYLPPVILCRGF